MTDPKPHSTDWSDPNSLKKTPINTTKSDATQINISGEAFQLLYQTSLKMADIESQHPPERVDQLVQKAVALILRAEGKEIVIRERGATQGDTVLLWK